MHGVSKTRLAVVLAVLVAAILPLSWYQTTASPDGRMPPPTKTAESQDRVFIDLRIENAGAIMVNGEETSLPDFPGAVVKAAAGNEERAVIGLACAPDLPVPVLFEVQQILVEKGLNKVMYRSELAEAMPLVLPGKEARERLAEVPKEDVAAVLVKNSRELYYNHERVPVGQLHEHVKKHVAKNDHLIVRITMDEGAVYSDFARVLHEVKMGDAKRIVIM